MWITTRYVCGCARIEESIRLGRYKDGRPATAVTFRHWTRCLNHPTGLPPTP